MLKEEQLRKDKKKYIIFTSIIMVVSVFIVTVLIGFKLNPIQPLIDEGGIAARDVVVHEDYYDESATLLKADTVKYNVKNVVLELDEKTYAAFDEIIKFFSATDSYRTKMSLAYQSSYNTDEDRKAIVSEYMAYSSNLGMAFSEVEIKELLSNISLIEYENYKNKYKVIFTSIQVEEISYENLNDYVAKLNDELSKVVSNEALLSMGNQIAGKFLRVNSIIDLQATVLRQKEAYNDVIDNYPEIIKEGTKLTTKGEVVSEDMKRLLGDMDLLRNNINFPLFAIIFVFVLLMIMPVIAYKLMVIKNYLITVKQLIMISLVIIIMFVFALVIPDEYYLMIPVLLVPMMLSMLTNHKIAIIITVPLSILLTVMLGVGFEYMIMVMTGGILAVYLVKNTNNRLKYAASGILVGLINVIIMMVVLLIKGQTFAMMGTDFIYIVISGVISSVISLGLLPVFESLFNIITPFKLLELSNPSQPLINQMLLEAPGTYHHSLMVGNLAEAGAEAIEANGLLARVGAYYHDIGKLNRPKFFSENQTDNSNPHDKMTPSLSTFVITNHTKEGEELARKNKLPHAIRNIIAEHHGTTLVRYFYHKASQTEDVSEKDFRYPGPRPTSKESAVVMLADTVEAGIRSMNKTSEGEIQGVIRKLVKEKLDDGQLALCDLTLKDLDNVSDAFTRVFSGYFHSRIQYPEKDGEIVDEIKN